MSAFAGGFSQFFIPTHLLAVLALGLLAAQIRARSIIVLGVFSAGLLAGSLAVASAAGETSTTPALLGMAAIAALPVVMDRAPPAAVGILLEGLAGGAIPLNAPPHDITIAGAIAAQIGLAVAALITLGVTMLIAARAQRPWHRIALRVAGSWVAASAILALALRLAR